MNIKNNLAEVYVVANAINCQGKDFKPIGTANNPFTGQLDGAGHTISNVSIGNGNPTAGIFGFTRNAIIKKINLDKIEVNVTDTTEALATLVGIAERSTIQSVTVNGNVRGNETSRYVGGLVGLLKDYSSINGSSISVEVVAANPEGYVGGIAGQQIISTVGYSSSTGNVTGYSNVGGLTGNMKGGRIDISYASGAVTSPYQNAYNVGGLVGSIDPPTNSRTEGAVISKSYATGNVQGNPASSFRIGGLVGSTNHGYGPTIEYSFSTGNVTGHHSVGGLLGYNWSSPITINNTYAVGMVTANYKSGGLVGENIMAPNNYHVIKSYWDIEKTRQLVSDGGIGKTTAELYQQNTYYLWNFDSTWRIEEGVSYPQLKNSTQLVYDIKNCNDLQNINKYPSRAYRLVNDIDCANNRFQPIGSKEVAFTGMLNGNGHTISNLTIHSPNSANVGLFRTTIGAYLLNIRLKNVDIIGPGYVGALIGQAISTKISTISVDGHVVGSGHVGGLIGAMKSTQIFNSQSSATVEATGSNVGGFVGYYLDISDDFILNSYTNGIVRGQNSVGGLVGFIVTNYTLKFSNVYSSSTLEARCDKNDTYCWIGGLVGSGSNNIVKASNSYYDNQKSGYTNSSSGEGKTTAELYQKDTYRNWDFENIWGITDGSPYLKAMEK